MCALSSNIPGVHEDRPEAPAQPSPGTIQTHSPDPRAAAPWPARWAPEGSGEQRLQEGGKEAPASTQGKPALWGGGSWGQLQAPFFCNKYTYFS